MTKYGRAPSTKAPTDVLLITVVAAVGDAVVRLASATEDTDATVNAKGAAVYVFALVD